MRYLCRVWKLPGKCSSPPISQHPVSRQCLIGSLPSSCRSFTSRPCVCECFSHIHEVIQATTWLHVRVIWIHLGDNYRNSIAKYLALVEWGDSLIFLEDSKHSDGQVPPWQAAALYATWAAPCRTKDEAKAHFGTFGHHWAPRKPWPAWWSKTPSTWTTPFCA